MMIIKRPTTISKLQTNELAAYFEESNGGYGYGFKSLKAGESEVYHLGYLWMKIKWKI